MPSTFVHYLHDFLSYISAEKGLTPNSVEAYQRDTERFLQFCEKEGIVKIRDIQENTIVNYLGGLKSLGYASASLHRAFIAIKVFFRFLKREGEITINPTQHLTTPKLWQLIPEVLTQSEMEKLLAQPDLSTFEGARDRAILEILYGSGLRVSELCSLKINSIDDGYVRVMGKGRKERVVPIGSKALEAIDYYLTSFRDATADSQRQDLFVTEHGKAVDRIYIWKIIKKVANDAGLHKRVSPHTLRHTFATHLVDHGAELRVIQEMLGHASISSTDRYTHISKSHLQEAFKAFHPRS